MLKVPPIYKSTILTQPTEVSSVKLAKAVINLIILMASAEPQTWANHRSILPILTLTGCHEKLRLGRYSFDLN